MNQSQLQNLLKKIESWAQELGFAQVGVSDIDLSEAEEHLKNWITKGFHADMEYMHKHGSKRTNPEELVEGTVRILSLRMDYFDKSIIPYEDLLAQPDKAAISRYALGRDYHKVIRKNLKTLAEKIKTEVQDFEYRVFTDSAPVMEKAIAEKAGLGWIGKHSNLINSKSGSYFFLGEIYTNIPFPISKKATFHCGTCTKCIDACPTKAIVSPFQVDSRRCISYLTIENKGEIPKEFHKDMGNRIYGCDDCQVACPWTKFTQQTQIKDFQARHKLDNLSLEELDSWDEETFLKNTEGSPIRRIGYKAWKRNLEVAISNFNAKKRPYK